MVTVSATRRFWYGGKDVAVGASVSMTPTDALVHARKGHVTLSKPAKKPTPPPAPATPTAPDQDEPRQRRQYRRRDMLPEQMHETVVTPDDPVVSSRTMFEPPE